MPRFLPDTDIQKLLGDVIRNGDESLINPNGIELRLGSQARFISTGEIK
jgi:deoxycytidine triphosphate deaminase